MTMTNKKAILKLQNLQDLTKLITEPPKLQLVLCIYYPILIQEKLVEAFINLVSEVNAISPTYVKKLGLLVQRTEIGT